MTFFSEYLYRGLNQLSLEWHLIANSIRYVCIASKDYNYLDANIFL